jgi:hypothetical protein
VELRELKVFWDQQELQVCQVREVILVIQVLKEQLVFKVHQVQ